MDAFEAIFARHSYRGKYINQSVPREDLKKIMEAGLAAPSGCNTQTVSLVAVDDKALMDRMYSVTRHTLGRTAPAVICVLTRRVSAYKGMFFNVQDYSAAIENMLVAAVALGYASCWYEGYLTDDENVGRKMADALGIPEEYEMVCILPIGIPADEIINVPKKPFDERAWFNGFDK